MKYYKAKDPDIVLLIKSDSYDVNIPTFSGEVIQSKDGKHFKGEIRSDWNTILFEEVVTNTDNDKKDDEVKVKGPVKPVSMKPFPSLDSLKRVSITLPRYYKVLFGLKNHEFVFDKSVITQHYNLLKKYYDEGNEVEWIARTVLDPKVAITNLLNGEILYDDEGNKVKFDGKAFITIWGSKDNPQWDFVNNFDNLSKERG